MSAFGHRAYALRRAIAMLGQRPGRFLMGLLLATAALALPLLILAMAYTAAPWISRVQVGPEVSVFVKSGTAPTRDRSTAGAARRIGWRYERAPHSPRTGLCRARAPLEHRRNLGRERQSAARRPGCPFRMDAGSRHDRTRRCHCASMARCRCGAGGSAVVSPPDRRRPRGCDADAGARGSKPGLGASSR